MGFTTNEVLARLPDYDARRLAMILNKRFSRIEIRITRLDDSLTEVAISREFNKGKTVPGQEVFALINMFVAGYKAALEV